MTSTYHPVTPEIVPSEEMLGSLFVDCDDDHPTGDDVPLTMPDPDCPIQRLYRERTGKYHQRQFKPHRLFRTPKHNPIP